MYGVALLFFVVTLVTAQERPHIELRFLVSDELNAGVTLRCGIDSTATDGIDPTLGEFPLPGHPPSGFHAGWEIVSNGIGDLSYTDIRPYPDSTVEHFYRDYSLNISPRFAGRGDLLIFRWDYPLPKGIDSVVVMDRLQGALVRFQFGPSRMDTLRGSNAELERFLVRVYYSPARTLTIMDQPRMQLHLLSSSDGEIVIPVIGQPMKVMLYSLLGKHVEVTPCFEVDALHLPVNHLPAGWYILVLSFLDGTRIKYTFVR